MSEESIRTQHTKSVIETLTRNYSKQINTIEIQDMFATHDCCCCCSCCGGFCPKRFVVDPDGKFPNAEFPAGNVGWACRGFGAELVPHRVGCCCCCWPCGWVFRVDPKRLVGWLLFVAFPKTLGPNAFDCGCCC